MTSTEELLSSHALTAGTIQLRHRPEGIADGLTKDICCCNALFTQPGDVLDWRTPEEAAVISTELRGAYIPHLPTRCARVRNRGQHQTPRLLKAQRLLVLQ